MSANKHGTDAAPTPSGVYFREPLHASPAPQLPPVYQETERIRVGEWEAGLCGCCTHCVPNCCMVTFCPCFSLAQISDRLGVMSYGVTLAIYLVVQVALWALQGLSYYETYNDFVDWNDNIDDGGYYNGYFFHYDDSDTFELSFSAKLYSSISSAAYLLVFIFVMHLRSKTRERFGIQGSCCGDCSAAFWCTCCSMAQIATHIKSYKPGSCDFGPRDTLPAYPEARAINYA